MILVFLFVQLVILLCFVGAQDCTTISTYNIVALIYQHICQWFLTSFQSQEHILFLQKQYKNQYHGVQILLQWKETKNLQTIITSRMNWVKSWLKPAQQKYEINTKQHIHTDQTILTHHCCSYICNQKCRQICDQCIKKHHGHSLMQYKPFKRAERSALEQLTLKQKIQQQFRNFHKRILESFQQILDKEATKFISQIESKIYSKNFNQIYKRYKSQKKYYEFIPEFTPSKADKVYDLILNTIHQKENKVIESIKNFVSEQKMIINDSIMKDITSLYGKPVLSKIDKLKSILPFQAQLNSKFTASKNRFQAEKLHATGIRGPILLVAYSSKGRVFGGFTPKMFPKDEHYQQDNRCRSFLFSLDHFTRLPLKEEYKKFAIKGGNNLWFGRGDLVLADQCNKGNISWAQVGRAYQLPPGLNCDPDEYLAGSLYFQIVEYEIYQVQLSSFAPK